MLTKLWRKLRQQDRVEELERENDKLLQYRDWECVHCSSPAPLPEDHWQTCPNHPARKRVAELERELETYKGQWKHALETYGEQEFKITNLTIENERLKDELDRERSDCAELDQENERLKQELEELEDR